MEDKNNKNRKKKQENRKKKSDSKMNLKRRLLSIVVIAVVIFVMMLPFLNLGKEGEPQEPKPFSEFMEMVDDGLVEEVNYSSSKYISFKMKDSDELQHTDNPRDAGFKREMLEKGVKVNEVTAGDPVFEAFVSTISLFVQYGLMFGIVFFGMKYAMNLFQGNDKMEIMTESTSSFKDVAGLEEVKESLMTTVDMLKHPDRYQAAGARIPKGILLAGPPGTGKTLLARAVAGEAGVSFLAVSGADFDNKYVGVGADKVRKIFHMAKEKAPCILFIDEIDAVGVKRGREDGAYARQTINQLLSCMDGFDTTSGVFIFAATNDPESLDPALLRPGRFDACFTVGMPETTAEREQIIRMYLKDKKVDENVSLAVLAKQTIGMSPAAIEAMINEAAIESVQGGGVITRENLDEAFYRQLMNGHKKRHTQRDDAEIRTVAWHEAGHALMGYLQKEDVSKISIVPSTSGAGGVTIFNPKKLGLYTKRELMNRVRTMYAGRIAEELLNGEMDATTGAVSDIKEATKCIRQMVCNYGMSKFCLLNMDEVKAPESSIMDECLKIAQALEVETRKVLWENKDVLAGLAEELMTKETMDEREVESFFRQRFEAEETCEV